MMMSDPIFLLDELMHLIERYMVPADIERVHNAYKLADLAHQGVTRKSGELYITHPLSVAILLAGMRVDADTLSAALLHDVVEDTPYTVDDIARLANPDVARLVDGVTKLDKRNFETKQDAVIASFRKMMEYFADDYRVVLVKLADRLHNLRTLEHQSLSARQRIAKETIAVYVPLAQRMGLNVIRREMQLLAFRNMHPWRSVILQESLDAYMNAHKEQHDEIIKNISNALQDPIPSANVFLWEKNLYRVYERLKQGEGSFRDQKKIIEIRIVVGTIDECYRALGLVHSLYRPKLGGMNDFIAHPHQTYGFQALQTCVYRSKKESLDNILRIQIQTRDMFQVSQYGIAAAWRHPELNKRGNGKIAEAAVERWLEQVRELSSFAENPLEFHNYIQSALFLSEVYAFTPQGDIKEFPAGATLVDFAYAIHTDIGDHCVAGEVDGVEMPLRTKIPNGATVKILTDKHALPQLSWLDYVVTPRARVALRNWQRQQSADDFTRLGKVLLNKALKTAHITVETLDQQRLETLLTSLSLKDLPMLLCAIGKKEYSAALIAKRLTEEASNTTETDSGERLVIQGSQGLATQFANCCYPIPGDSLEAYLDPLLGLILHRQSCPHLHAQVDANDIMEVDWAEQQPDQLYKAGVKTYAHNVVGVLRQITSALAQQHVNIEDIHTSGDTYIKETKWVLWVHNLDQVDKVMRQLNHIPDITKVERITEGINT
ncbi:MAG: hypothetical protein RLZZ422_1796 [Pseudomonadota bacterium]|jgi:RelA/SpoT family (p)ppGpp synthetase